MTMWPDVTPGHRTSRASSVERGSGEEDGGVSTRGAVGRVEERGRAVLIEAAGIDVHMQSVGGSLGGRVGEDEQLGTQGRAIESVANGGVGAGKGVPERGKRVEQARVDTVVGGLGMTRRGDLLTTHGEESMGVECQGGDQVGEGERLLEAGARDDAGVGRGGGASQEHFGPQGTVACDDKGEASEQGRGAGEGVGVGVERGVVDKQATLVTAIGRGGVVATHEGVTGVAAGVTMTGPSPESLPAPADSGSSAVLAKEQRWAAGGKVARHSKLSLTRSAWHHPYGTTPAPVQRGQDLQMERPRESVARSNASLTKDQLERIQRNKQAAIARREQVLEQAEEEWLRRVDWAALEGGGGHEEQAEGSIRTDTLVACLVCERLMADSEGGADVRIDCAICHKAFHAACYYAPGVLLEYPVHRWQAEGVWICGMCVEGEEYSSSMVAQASGGLEQDSEAPPAQTDAGSQASSGPRRTRGQGFVTGPGLWRGGGLVSAALNLSVVFKGPQQLFPSARKCASCGKLTKQSRCACGWDTVTVLRQNLKLSDLLAGRHSWAAPPRFCSKCTAWMPWKCWSAGAAAAAGGLLNAIGRVGLDVFQEATAGSTSSSEARHLIVEGVVKFVMACTVAICRPRAAPAQEGLDQGCVCGQPGHGKAASGGDVAGGWAGASSGSQIPVGLRNVGGSCGVATLVQLLRANTDVRHVLAASRHTLPGDRVWNSLSALLMAMDSQADTGMYLAELIRVWQAEGILLRRGAGIDPAEVLLRLVGRPGAISEELQRLVSFTHRRRSSCPTCGREATVVTPQVSFVASSARSLQCQIHRLTRETRSCTTCGGTSHDGHVAWSSLGAVLLVQGNFSFSHIPVELRVRVDSHSVALALVAVFEHRQAHHRLYLRSQRDRRHGGWLLFDDADVRPMGRAVATGEDMFRQSETSERSTFWVYARQATGNLHAYNLGLHQPCGLDCGEESCCNQDTCGRVHEGECSWLLNQKGLFASGDLRRGSWVARFDTLDSLVANSKQRAEGTFLMQVRRLSEEGLGVVRVMQQLGGGLAMLANATCCSLHRNAEIAQDANDVVWIRLVADVCAGDEILVDYGRGFFASESCVCCSCAGRCTSSASGEHASGGQ